jgi:hypothetical protein
MVGGATHPTADWSLVLIRASRDAEPAIAGDGNRDHVHVLDAGARRPVPAPFDYAFHCGGRSFEFGFDCAIGSVANESGNAVGASFVAAGVAIPDTLYASGDDGPNAHCVDRRHT